MASTVTIRYGETTVVRVGASGPQGPAASVIPHYIAAHIGADETGLPNGGCIGWFEPSGHEAGPVWRDHTRVGQSFSNQIMGAAQFGPTYWGTDTHPVNGTVATFDGLTDGTGNLGTQFAGYSLATVGSYTMMLAMRIPSGGNTDHHRYTGGYWGAQEPGLIHPAGEPLTALSVGADGDNIGPIYLPTLDDWYVVTYTAPFADGGYGYIYFGNPFAPTQQQARSLTEGMVDSVVAFGGCRAVPSERGAIDLGEIVWFAGGVDYSDTVTVNAVYEYLAAKWEA